MTYDYLRNRANFLTSTDSLTKAMEKMWEIEKLPLDDSPSSLTWDETIAINVLANECILMND